MALSTINPSFAGAGKGAQFYLTSRPTAGFTGANLAAYATSVYSQFYTLGSQRYTPLMAQYLNPTDKGYDLKIKQNVVESDFQNGSKEPAFIRDLEAHLEMEFYDVDVQHLKDIFGAGSLDVFQTAAASGVAQRDNMAFGNQIYLPYYSLMLRVPSGNKVLRTGGSGFEFDHFLFPRTVCVFDADFDCTKMKQRSCKIKFTALYDPTILDAAGNAVLGFADTATGAAS